MTPIENRLLSNALDSLDRLFDRESSAIDVAALFQATAEALRDTPHSAMFADATAALEPIISSRHNPEVEYDEALKATGNIRLYLASLPIEYPGLPR